MSKAGQSTDLCYKATEERYKTKEAYIILEPPNFGNQKFLTFEAVTPRSKVALRNLGSGMLNCVVISLEGKTMTPMICKVAWVAPLYV
ncbi:hypothetical protein SO802_033659 [Lithocarpus litseifolius]|uniref:Uncharacterized protein n=1 Tax=Lithocarpus litseifolius TaxID=425828 RepID=A0AAW2BGK2_9ROSI